MGVSGGQQQRLCIARYRATAGGDPFRRADLPPRPDLDRADRETIEEQRAEFAIVIATPTMQRGARLSQLTVFLYLGELVELGPTSQAFMNPGEKRTLNYVTGRFG